MEYLLKNIFWFFLIVGVIFFIRKIRHGKRVTIVQELIAGIIMGNVVFLGIPYFETMKHSIILESISELAISFFLFYIGFSATLGEMRKVGFRAFLVALVGVGSSFTLGLYFVPYLIPNLSDLQYVFIAAALTTTSVGITAGILKELGKLEFRSAKIILGAAAIDDIISLFILSVIATQLKSGLTGIAGVDFGILKMVVFIALGIGIGKLAAQYLSRFFYKIYPHVNAKLFIALSFFVIFFFGSKAIGLSPIVGAFIGGLVLERGRFDGAGNELHVKYVESIIERISAFVVPFFYIMTGIQMHVDALFSVQTIMLALGLFFIAVIGKLSCGLVSGKGTDSWLVGFGMVPRGEVGLVFANIGLALGMFSPDIFSAVIVMVMATTLLAPTVLSRIAQNTAT